MDNKKTSPANLREEEVTKTETAFDVGFLKDMENEVSFLANLKKADVSKDIGIQDEVTVMVKVLNEQIESLCRLRFDTEIYSELEKLDFNTYHKKRVEAESSLNLRRVTVATIRNQLIKRSIAYKVTKEALQQ